MLCVRFGNATNMFFKDDYSVIMRTFWPVSPVVGEGVLRVCEELSKNKNVSVILQDQAGIKAALQKNARGAAVKFIPILSLTTSSSGMVLRVIDLLWFTFASIFALLLRRPRIVYVSTDPPLLVPFIVMVYCWLTSARYVYHVQDIHPEATSIVFKLPKLMTALLVKVDALVVRRATMVITLTDDMVKSLQSRNGHTREFQLIQNPAADLPHSSEEVTHFDYSFVGNAGRLQRIELLIEAISLYLSNGGRSTFVFAGAGVNANSLTYLSNQYPCCVKYLGKVTVDKASEITQSSTWAMLPIDDDVCRYAFPSKASTYAVSNAAILAICDSQTSVAKWINNHNLGVIVRPQVEALVSFFDSVEAGLIEPVASGTNPGLQEAFSEETFVTKLYSLLNDI